MRNFAKIISAIGSVYCLVLAGCNRKTKKEAATSPQPAAACEKGAAWEEQLGRTITVTGTAQNLKLGAVVDTEKGMIWLDGIDSWPDDLNGRKVKVEGTVIKKNDLPVFIEKKEGEPQVSGMPVPEGTDLEKAGLRYLLENPGWEAL